MNIRKSIDSHNNGDPKLVGVLYLLAKVGETLLKQLQIIRGDRHTCLTAGDDHVSKSFPHVLETGGQCENGHYLTCHCDVKLTHACLALLLWALANCDASQKSPTELNLSKLPFPLAGGHQSLVEGFICLCGLVEHASIKLGGQQIVGGSDGVDITCQVEVELLHGNHLRCYIPSNNHIFPIRLCPKPLEHLEGHLGLQFPKQIHLLWQQVELPSQEAYHLGRLGLGNINSIPPSNYPPFSNTSHIPTWYGVDPTVNDNSPRLDPVLLYKPWSPYSHHQDVRFTHLLINQLYTDHIREVGCLGVTDGDRRMIPGTISSKLFSAPTRFLDEFETTSWCTRNDAVSHVTPRKLACILLRPLNEIINQGQVMTGKCDYEGFLCTLLYEKKYRPAAYALRAFYIELAQGKPPQTPITEEVAKLIEKHNVSKMWFTRIIDERVRQVETDMFRTLKEVEDAAENTVSSLNYLLLQSAGVADLNADHAASHLGRCQGLVTLLRATHYHASRNKVYIPTELLLKHNVSQEQIYRQSNEDNVQDLIYDIASQAHIHLQTARSFKDKVPRVAFQFFLQSAICDKYLRELQRAHFNVFDSRLYLPPRQQRLPWELFKQKYFKRSY
ncbi:NDUF6-like protein [Mya arenaria]|uniref:NDUF6-like protein n=1 Tax=Mya arenaria TaxID=6604 RepID=A0ABY7FA61_MYAAR|nr:NDUF6-like protein [Mya arenaria]